MKKWIMEMDYGCEPWHCNEKDCEQWTTCKGPDPIANAVPYEPVDRAKSSAPVESLAELADRKGIGRIHINSFRGQWHVSFWPYYGKDEPLASYHGKTYAEAESKARAYLNSLPDNASK